MQKRKNEELGRMSPGEFKQADKVPVVLVLDHLRSLNNVGSLFRTADAFRVEKLYLCGITATPPHREIHKTALGATESVSWEYHEDTLSLIRGLRQGGYRIVSLEQAHGAVSLERYAFRPDQKYALVFGNEIKGVSQEVVDQSDDCIEIPQFGTKHSFNVVVSAGIVLWDYFSKTLVTGK